MNRMHDLAAFIDSARPFLETVGVLLLASAYFIGWAGVVYAAFCRMTKLGPQSRYIVRVGTGALMAAGCTMLIAPIAWHMPVMPVTAAAGSALTLFFASVRGAWQDGTPAGLNRANSAGPQP